jgi:hypothetical protein
VELIGEDLRLDGWVVRHDPLDVFCRGVEDSYTGNVSAVCNRADNRKQARHV